MVSAETDVADAPEKHPTILFVDDEVSVLNALKRFARSKKWKADIAVGGEEGLAKAAVSNYDIVISDMRMPKMNGADFLLKMKQYHPATVRILLTGYSDMESLERAINESHIFNYITKPWNEFVLKEVIENAFNFVESKRENQRLEELTQSQNKKLGKLAIMLNKQLKETKEEAEEVKELLSCQIESLKQSAFDSLSIVTQIIDWKEGGDHAQADFVREYSEKLARKIKVNEYDIEKLKIAAMLYRIGLIGLPDDLRMRPYYTLNPQERKLYQKYPEWSEMALSSNVQLNEVGKIIRHHQEYVNGTGFPDALIDRDIPVGSKIICLVSDFYDTYNGRKVKGSSGLEAAKLFIKEWQGKRYDTGLVSAFFELLEDFEEPELSTKLIELVSIEPGDIIAEDILTANGLLLLKRGSVITDEHISRLKRHQKTIGENLEITIEHNMASVEEE